MSTAALALCFAAPLAMRYLHHPMSLGTVLAFSAATAGYGLLPDIDHPQSTLARTFGPLTSALARTVSRVSGGHRKFTHTLWFAALMIVVVDLLVLRAGRWADWLVAGVGFYLAAMVLRLAPRRGSAGSEMAYALEATVAVAVYQHFDGNWWWTPWAVAFGVLGHITGDILTTEGVPILYPLVPHFIVRAPVLGTTDHWRERLFAISLGPILIWLCLAALTGNAWYRLAWAAHPGTWHLAGA